MSTVTVGDISTVSTLNSQDELKVSTDCTPDTIKRTEVITPSTDIGTNLSRDMGLEKSKMTQTTLSLDHLKKNSRHQVLLQVRLRGSLKTSPYILSVVL